MAVVSVVVTQLVRIVTLSRCVIYIFSQCFDTLGWLDIRKSVLPLKILKNQHKTICKGLQLLLSIGFFCENNDLNNSYIISIIIFINII